MTMRSIYRILCPAIVLALQLFTAIPSSPQSASPNVSLTGMVSCSVCQAKHSRPKLKIYTRLSCTQYCLANLSANYVLVVGNNTYSLGGDRDQIKKFAGGDATITGTLQGTQLKVASIEAPHKKLKSANDPPTTKWVNSPSAAVNAEVAFQESSAVEKAITSSFSSPLSPYAAPASLSAQILPGPSNLFAQETTAAAASNSASFFKRFGRAYKDDWKPGAQDAPSLAKRGDPSPVDGPPFPFSDWPYGGSVDIGAPWTQAGPLMTALWTGPHGDAWKKSGIQIYGWLNFGGNFSTSKSNALGKYANFPTAYDEVPNAIEPDQQVLYIERQPNTVQTDHFDWGFRLAGLWGQDYRFTTSKGIFSSQLLGHTHRDGTFGRQYGFDPVMFYVDLYVPHVAQGMNIRIGRYISLPDIEAQLAPNNYTYSHSLLYTFDCYTQVGINTTIKLSNHWLVQGGVSPGCDVAPWTTSDRKLTANFCVSYTWTEGRNNLYACDNSLNDGKYAYNNLQAVYLTWYHKFGKSSWHSSTEAWYQYEKQTPNVCFNSTFPNCLPGPRPTEINANGAFCKDRTQVTCFAPEWAFLNYLEDQIGKHNYLTIRNEYFDDKVGQRTGIKTRYTEHELMWGHWIGTTILFRPELRFERSYDRPAYQNTSKKNQLTAAADIIWFF